MQKYLNYLISSLDGKPIGGASVLVNVSSGGAANIFSDNGVTPTSNPLTTESDGSFYFFAANGLYDLVITKSGMTFDADDTSKISLFDRTDHPIIYLSPVGGTGNAITLTPVPAIAAYVVGQKFSFIASAGNTGATTVAISGLAAKNITKNGASALGSGDISSGELVEIIYDGTQFQMKV